MAPNTASFVDAGLPVGSTFTTADSMWRITVNSQSGSGANSLINVTVSAFAPTITTQPTSVTTSYGSAVSFSVVATGTSLTYQWLKDNVTLTGETSATLSIPNFQSANSGSYTVIVTNANGSVTSNAATLAVSESSGGGGGGGGCGYTTPPEQILLIGWAVLLLCRFLQPLRVNPLQPREEAA